MRIEVHDRSGELDLERARIPETMVALANVLHIEHIKAIGANWEVIIKLPEGVTASVLYMSSPLPKIQNGLVASFFFWFLTTISNLNQNIDILNNSRFNQLT